MRITPPNTLRRSILALVLAAGGAVPLHASAADPELLNVSYDVARELYKEINPAFIADVQAADGRDGRSQAIARRLEQAGARRGRRPGSVGRHHEPGQ